MKKFKWLLTGSAVLCLAIVFLAGCGVSQADYDALQAENEDLQLDLASLQADYNTLNSDYQATSDELAQLQELYPPSDFPSRTALEDWLLENDVSEKPITTTVQAWYGRALEVQGDAMADGYLISVDYDYVDEGVAVYCSAIINGRIFNWDPETDDIFEDTLMGTVK